MENRFGVKDFVTMILLVVLILSVWFAMKQYDRQWTDIQQIAGDLKDQKREIEGIRRELARGVSVIGNAGGAGTGAANPTTGPRGDPFVSVREARAKPDFAEGDWLIEASAPMASLTPHISTDVYARLVEELVLETLMGRDPHTLEWMPGLATDWDVKDHSAEYTKWVDEQKSKGRNEEDIRKDTTGPVAVTITLTLRNDARFSDGVPVTPDDVLFTFNLIRDERYAVPRIRAYYEMIRSVERKGDNQIVFKFNEPYYDVMTLAGGLYAMPKHFYSKYTPEQYNQSVGLLMGSGPYRLEDPTAWKPGGGQVVLVRNERYWGVPAAFDRVVFREFTNDIAKQTAFRNGEIDVFEARPEQFRSMTAETDLMGRSQKFEWLSLNGGYRYVAWQQLRDGKKTPFADKRVRQAMALLVDRARLVQEIMLGYSVQATGPFSPIGMQADKNIQPVPYDVAAGKKLLADAGFKDNNGDGVLETPEGRPFRFKITYPSGSANYEKMVLAFKDAYARAGIVLDPDPLEWAVFAQKLKNKDFDAITLGWGGGNPESDIYQMFHSKWTQPHGDNFMCYINPELDRVLEQARSTIDQKKRIPLWHKAHQIIHDDQPYMFLWFTKDLYLVDGRIRNVRTDKLGLPGPVRFEWYVPQKLQKRGR